MYLVYKQINYSLYSFAKINLANVIKDKYFIDKNCRIIAIAFYFINSTIKSIENNYNKYVREIASLKNVLVEIFNRLC